MRYIIKGISECVIIKPLFFFGIFLSPSLIDEDTPFLYFLFIINIIFLLFNRIFLMLT